MERIDKILSKSLNISRNDAKSLIKKGLVSVCSKKVKSCSEKYDETCSEIFFDGKKICFEKYVYIMMNKPKGVISASEGKNEKTVIDILPDGMKRKNLFPAGRLDKDTTGFVLITDDGDFAHRILSPRKHIEKTYIALLDKPFGEELVQAFERGVELKEDICMPAVITPVNDDYTEAQVIIKQGMYHQIKRMFSAFGITVKELKRVKMGNLPLDESLPEGMCRYITKDELNLIEQL